MTETNSILKVMAICVLLLFACSNIERKPNVSEDKRESALEELQGYYAHCTATDKAIGEIIDKVKELGIYDKSIIVFTSDHGELMGAHDFKPLSKMAAYSESSNVPFLISYPGIMKSPHIDSERAALYMNIVPFGGMYKLDEYRAIRTNKYTYVKTPQGASMHFDDENDVYQMSNLVNQPDYADVQKILDKQMMNELRRIGEEKIMEREHYLKKFGYYGQKEFDPRYVIAVKTNVEVVVTPHRTFRIRD